MRDEYLILLLKKYRFRITSMKISFTLLLFIICYLIVEPFFPIHKPNSPQLASLEKNESLTEIENGIHIPTGLYAGPGFETTRSVCLACHSAKLITQNRASADGWKEMIDWMQKTQGLPDLGKKESEIINYLATYYAPIETGRRPVLDTNYIEWYVLKLAE
jgi:hypothetical protein